MRIFSPLRKHAAAAACASACAALAQTPVPESARAAALPPLAEPESAQTQLTQRLGVIVVESRAATSLPTIIPASMHGISREQIAQQVNATDSADALKYFPSLNVRKRYIGDYDHAVLASRASGTGNSARALVFVDGILLSNLLGNGASYTPRWGMVGPQEIERVDVMYGPYSAAYSGNSVGAVVDFVTRMPSRFEASAQLGGFTQEFAQYGPKDRFGGVQAAASLGNRHGALSWRASIARTDSTSQPFVWVTKPVATASSPATGVAVTGAVRDLNPRNQAWLVIGETNLADTSQTQARLRLAYDVSPGLRASYQLGLWHNDTTRDAKTYLRDAAGREVSSGSVRIDGASYTVAPADFSVRREDLQHAIHSVQLQQRSAARGAGSLDWTLQASALSYLRDTVRSSSVDLAAARSGGAGSMTRLDGTGWHNAAARGTYRWLAGANALHTLDFGVQHEAYELRQERLALANWSEGPAGARTGASAGETAVTALYAQNHWAPTEATRATLGVRWEQWRASDGLSQGSGAATRYAVRQESAASPKLALAMALREDVSIKAALGKAVRWPTVAELYQTSNALGDAINNDPNLKPEQSWTGELSLEQTASWGQWRATAFAERTRDALYSQTNLITRANTVQNIARVATTGLEATLQLSDVAQLRGLRLEASATHARSIIKSNPAQPASVGKRQPRVPDWRASLSATYAPTSAWSLSLGARYSGRQFNQLDNSDIDENSFQSVSRYAVLDLRARWQLAREWSASVGIDNLGNRRYWAFHAYPARTFHAQLQWTHAGL